MNKIAVGLLASMVSMGAMAGQLSLVSTFGEGSGFKAYDLQYNDERMIFGQGADGKSLQIWDGTQFQTPVSSAAPLDIVPYSYGALYTTQDSNGQVVHGYATYEKPIPGVYAGGNYNEVIPESRWCQIYRTVSNACAGSEPGIVAQNGWQDYVVVSDKGGVPTATANILKRGGVSAASYELGTFGSIAGYNSNGVIAGVIDGQAMRFKITDGRVDKVNMLASVPGASNIRVYDMNRADQVVGQYTDANGKDVPFLYGYDGLTNLNEAMSETGLSWAPGTVMGLGNNGPIQLVMTVQQNGFLSSAVFLTPASSLPEPGSAAFFGLGLLGLCLVARRRSLQQQH